MTAWTVGQHVRVRHEGGNTVLMVAEGDGGWCDPAYYLAHPGWTLDYVGDERPLPGPLHQHPTQGDPMTAPTHTCTPDTCWKACTAHEDSAGLCLERKPGRLGKGYTRDHCGLPWMHRYEDHSPHEYSLRLGPSRAQLRRVRRVASKSAIIAGTVGIIAAYVLVAVLGFTTR